MKYTILQKRGQIYQVHYFDGFKVIYHEIVHFTEKRLPAKYTSLWWFGG